MSSTDDLLAEVDSTTGRDPERDGDRESSGRSDGGGRAATQSGGGALERLRRRAGRVFSPRTFLLALVASVAGLAVVGGVVPVPGAGLAGIVAAGFLLGLVRERRAYLELAAAGAAAAGVGTVLNQLVLSFLAGVGVTLAAVGAGAGLLAAVFGHYLGRDLRDGLMREL